MIIVIIILSCILILKIKFINILLDATWAIAHVVSGRKKVNLFPGLISNIYNFYKKRVYFKKYFVYSIIIVLL